MNLSEQEKQVLTAGLILAAMIAFIVGYLYIMFWSPAIEQAREDQETLTEEVDTMEARIQEIEEVLADEDRYQEMLAQVERAKRRLPSDPEAIEFLSLLADSLNKTGVDVSSVDPVNPVDRTMYMEIPYAIAGSARYHEFGQFLNLIECHPDRFMRVSAFSLSNNQQRPSIHPINARIQTYMFKGV